MNCEMPLELFRKACGLGVPMTLAYQAEQSTVDAPTRLDSPAPFLLIGRSPKNELHMADPRVSRRHAYLQAVAGGVVCLDLQSRTQTFWDDQPEARSWGWLDPGRSIRIGPYRIERTDRQPDGNVRHDLLDPFASGGQPGSWPDPIPRPAFELPFRLGGIASTWEIPGLLALVGRADHCQFVLNDDSVSRTHACLVRTPMGTWVVDMAARDGVHVNGTRVRWAWLADGDILRFGRFTMVVRYDRQPDGIRRDDVPLEAGASPAGPHDDRPEDDLEPTGGEGRGLALRPVARPPGVAKASGPPRRVRPTVPATVPGGAWEPVAGAVPSPYALWQQQMQLMESFHNDMMMMVQMFIAMHREFQSSVRDELERVQKLTEELSRLNARLLPPSGPAVDRPKPNAVRPEGKARSVPRSERPGPEATAPPRKVHRRDASTGSKGGAQGDVAGAAARRPAIPGDQEDSVTAPILPRESADMYADITRRISELQGQRRGYWQRILKAINT